MRWYQCVPFDNLPVQRTVPFHFLPVGLFISSRSTWIAWRDKKYSNLPIILIKIRKEGHLEVRLVRIFINSVYQKWTSFQDICLREKTGPSNQGICSPFWTEKENNFCHGLKRFRKQVTNYFVLSPNNHAPLYLINNNVSITTLGNNRQQICGRISIS